MFTVEKLQAILDYILETENEDFDENPTKSHVYYKALVLQVGEVEAERYYFQILSDLEK